MLDRNDSAYVSFINHDNALIVDFLTSAAGVLSERGIISLKDVDNLRLAMSSVQSLDSSEKQSVLLALKSQNADFVETLSCLFGEFGFGINLLRHTVRNYLGALSSGFCSFGHDLLMKSQSLFNRSFSIYVNDASHYQVLFSSALVDLAQVFADANRTIESVQARCAAMITTGVDSKVSKDLDGIDQALSQAMGFLSTSRLCLPIATERSIMLDISCVLIEVADACEVFLNSLRKNIRKAVSPQLDFICEELRLEAGKLRETRFFRGDDLSTWEVRRLSIALAISKFTELTKVFKSNLLDAISIENTDNSESSDDLHRLIGLRLIASGISAHEAKSAAVKLTAYCRLHGIQPSQLLTAELPKIDRNLNEESLSILQKRYGDKSLNLSSTQEKNYNLTTSQALLKSFVTGIGATSTVSAILLAFTCALVSSCGFKTDPKSDVVDLRPELPFRISEGVQLPKTPAKPDEDVKR